MTKDRATKMAASAGERDAASQVVVSELRGMTFVNNY